MDDLADVTRPAGTFEWAKAHRRPYLRSGGAKGHIVNLTGAGGHPFGTHRLIRYVGRKSGRTMIRGPTYGDIGGKATICASSIATRRSSASGATRPGRSTGCWPRRRLRFLKRRDGVTRAAFDAHPQGDHAAVCAAAAGLVVRRWAMDDAVDGPPADVPYEAIDEGWFATAEDAAEALPQPAMDAVATSLGQVCDLGAG